MTQQSTSGNNLKTGVLSKEEWSRERETERVGQVIKHIIITLLNHQYWA